MRQYRVNLSIQPETHQKIMDITAALNQGERQSLSKPLGEVLTQLTCEVLEQAFGVLTRSQDDNTVSDEGMETEKILQQIYQHLQKYMPWSMSFFGNERLIPLANYMLSHFDLTQTDKIYLYYPLQQGLAQRFLRNFERLLSGETLAIEDIFRDLIDVVDEGIAILIREPKNMLKFNFVVDKTLNGVIGMVTNLGYKRIEKMGKNLPLQQAQHYARHFNTFVVVD